MPDYQWAVGKGKIITSDYDRTMSLNAEQVKNEVEKALSNLFENVDVSLVSDELKEVYKVTILREDITETIYICAKGMTPGGRSNLQNEQRIQQKAKYLNFAYDKKEEGKKAICLGVYKHDSEPIFCAWNINHSSASPETPISKQIKISTIARALTEGFVQQMTGSGEYVCAFRSDFIYFYISNSDWIHESSTLQLNNNNADTVEELDESLELFDFENQKERFKIWLSSQTKTNGELYSPNTVATYISQMERAYITFNPYKNYESVFQIANIDELTEYENYLFNTEGFDEFNNNAGNKACSNGFIKYEQYLKENKTLSNKIVFDTAISSDKARNIILFGAPGTGKSYTLNHERESLLGNEDDYERVTFHPDYSYANFVGTYKPVMVDDSFETISALTETDVVSVLTDERKTAQEKYDLLYDRFKDEGLITRLPLLLGIYTDQSFETRKIDGSRSVGDNSVERNHGRAIRPYVNLSKPSKKKKDISYEYVPGPFMRVLVKALKNAMTDKPRPFLLIIEEINRANVAAVFGEVFQLLDRDSNGVSEYKIATTYDMKKYLSEELGVDESQVETIKIPNNMFIWATMNSADQGVFPMDTAFKRRWDFTYLGIDDSDEKIRGKYVYLAEDKSQKVEWNKLRKAINDFLAKCKINEDKQLGPYFISKDIVVPKNGDEINREEFIKTFKNKVIMYLFEDAAKQKQSKLFEGCFDKSSRYSEICKEFETKGIGIFNSDIQIQCEVEDINTDKDDTNN